MTESVETCVLIANCDRLLDCHAKSICGRELSKIGLCDLVPVAVSAPRRANVLTEELITSGCRFSNAKVCRLVPVANERPCGLSLKSSCCAHAKGLAPKPMQSICGLCTCSYLLRFVFPQICNLSISSDVFLLKFLKNSQRRGHGTKFGRHTWN